MTTWNPKSGKYSINTGTTVDHFTPVPLHQMQSMTTALRRLAHHLSNTHMTVLTD